MTLSKYCMQIRDIPVDAISTDEVLAVLKPLWTKVPETASRLRGRIEKVLDAEGKRTAQRRKPGTLARPPGFLVTEAPKADAWPPQGSLLFGDPFPCGTAARF